jgi:sensor histidine kinase YesM
MSINKQRILHIIFWICSLLFLAWFYTQLTKEYRHTLVLVAIAWPVSLASIYFINLILIPRFLFREKYWKFGIFTGYTIVTAVWLVLLVVFIYFSLLVTKTDGRNFPFFIDVAFILAGLFLVIVAGVLAHVVRENFRMLKEKNELEKEQLGISARLKEIELQGLKSQFHPHFLFNTLNNLYSLSLKKSDQTPEMILKLSRLLDFSLYGSEKERVSITEEIEFLDNYLDIISMRFGSKLEIDFTKKVENPGFQIAPLLLIPFIENATKHGIGHGNNNRIEIRLAQKNKELNFRVFNSKPEIIPDKANMETETTGIGLNQVRTRLNIIYPGMHKLEITEDAKSFRINLNVNG